MTTSPTSESLRAEAARHDAEAAASFERCDTDGFLSQWASGLTANLRRREADLLDKGNRSEFLALFDLSGNWVPARRIEGQWGPRWMVLDTNGRRTGTYLPYLPARRRTLADKGFVEGYAIWPAHAEIVGESYTSCRVATIKSCPPEQRPDEVVTTDRWATADERSTRR